ncbi:heavy-metal-associated domain-containing protein [Halobacteriovorax sp.]|uniref:heavy-metal-associated domain-containing protein n=1 Tax=Halobacteriovorax sp. TaxID=2020862 RepID=UPI0035657F1A
MKKLGFLVEGMKCGACKGKIEKSLLAQENISKVDIDLNEKSVVLECSEETSTVEIKNSIEELGFTIPKSLRV